MTGAIVILFFAIIVAAGFGTAIYALSIRNPALKAASRRLEAEKRAAQAEAGSLRASMAAIRVRALAAADVDPLARSLADDIDRALSGREIN